MGKSGDKYFPKIVDWPCYLPNIRKCIGVGGLKDPQAISIIFVDDVILICYDFSVRDFGQITGTGTFTAVLSKNMNLFKPEWLLKQSVY